MLVPPSPKFHVQDTGPPVDKSLNCTMRGGRPDKVFAVNPALGFTCPVDDVVAVVVTAVVAVVVTDVVALVVTAVVAAVVAVVVGVAVWVAVAVAVALVVAVAVGLAVVTVAVVVAVVVTFAPATGSVQHATRITIINDTIVRGAMIRRTPPSL